MRFKPVNKTRGARLRAVKTALTGLRLQSGAGRPMLRTPVEPRPAVLLRATCISEIFLEGGFSDLSGESHHFGAGAFFVIGVCSGFGDGRIALFSGQSE